MRMLGAVLVIVLAAGCTEVYQDEDLQAIETQRKKKQAPAARPQSAADDAIDTVVIQKGKIHAGVRTAEKVRAIGAQREKDRKEAGLE